jgi:hypothetical protein
MAEWKLLLYLLVAAVIVGAVLGLVVGPFLAAVRMRRVRYCPLCHSMLVSPTATACHKCGRDVIGVSQKELHGRSNKGPVRIFGVQVTDDPGAPKLGSRDDLTHG